MQKKGADLTFEVADIDGDRFILVSWPLPNGAAPALTDAEHDVLRLLLLGKNNRAIAEARGTSRRTVANQISVLLRKFGVGSRLELIVRLSYSAGTNE